MIIRKSKRHTEHFSRSTQNSISAHRRFTTPLICTKNARRKLTSVSLSWIKINNQVKCYCVWSFFERNVFCVHYWWGRERRKVFPTDCGSFHLPGNSRAIQTFFPPPPLSLHLFFPLLSKCSSIQLPRIIL